MRASKPSLQLVVQPQGYFYELVTHALSKQHVSTRPETEFYLVNLLNQFMNASQLTEQPLALLIKEALEQPHPQKQGEQFKKVGDLSLYVAGYFQDSLNRKLVDVDYYIDMGGNAYQQVANRAPEEALRRTYLELADKFSSFVDVLADVSEATQPPKSEKDILRLYEVWVRTKSERAAKALQEAGHNVITLTGSDTAKSKGEKVAKFQKGDGDGDVFVMSDAVG